MASAHAHPASQTVTVEHGRRGPSLPTLTDPDLLLLNPETASSYNQYRGSSFLTSDTELSPSSSNGVLSPLSTDSFELGTAKTFLMPLRPKPALPLSNLLAYSGYEHGAPLSDIGEEETTPKSKRARSRTPSPTASSPTIAPQSSGWLGQNSQKRLSGMSNSSGISTGSDLHWEGFDTRAGISDRLRADLAAAVDDADDFGSRRDSTAINGDDENTTQALSERAEQILANAKKRLTNMEGNLSKARTSLLIGPKTSPTVGEFKQVGGLYRSISQGGDRRLVQGSNFRKSRPLYSPTNGTSPVHARNLSETSVPSGSVKHSKHPEVRSASAMEYGRGGRSIDSLLNEQSKSAFNKGHSTACNRSQNSPLTVLREEVGSDSTDFASPESSENTGLAIRGDKSRDFTNDYGYGLTRSQSQMSTRELRDQLNGLKNKIADLRTGQRAERSRRNSLQNLRAPNSFTEAEEWYAGAAEYKSGVSPLSTNAGMGLRSNKDLENAFRKSPTPPRSPKLPRSPKSPSSPRTPSSPSFAQNLAADDSQSNVVPTAYFGQDLHSYSSTPNPPPIPRAVDRDRDDQDSYIQDSLYEDAFEERSDEVDNSVAASQEEQIYLNEVLEESLQDAEPEVPSIPGMYQPVEPERHEDRADAFDYENFFLHSALGNYSQAGLHRRNISQATAESRMSYESSDSVETTRAPQTEDNGARFEVEGKEENVAGGERMNDSTFIEEEPPTPTGPQAPFAQHFRSNSTDSVSSTATFATATEGDNDSRAESDSVPSEILRWGERPSPSMVGAWPSPPASTPLGVVNLTNGHTSPLSTNVLSAENLTPNSGGPPPTPPASSPPQQQEENLQEEEEETSDSSSHQHSANTEILISALITLANPDFKPTGAFSEVDKDLVVNVLRSVGAVCEGINASDSRGDAYESRIWRRRLDVARRILEGEIEVEDE